MAYEASFGTLSSDVSPPSAGGPFRVAIFGDFSGRSNRGERGDRDEIAGRKPQEVAADKLDDLLAKYEARLTLPFGRDGGKIELAFEELDQFHPERLLKEADLVMDLIDLKGRVGRQEKQIVEWGRQFGAWGPLRPATRPAYGRTIAPVQAFSDFTQWQSVGTAESAGGGKLPEMIAQAVGGRAGELDDPSEETLEEIVHQAVGDAIREIIHHPDYQALESAWRGVDFIARRTFKGEKVKLVLFDVTAEELAVDLATADDLAESAIYDLLVNRTWQAAGGGDPWAMVVGLYEFDLTPPHAELLGRLGKLGALLQAPFLASLSQRVLGEEFALDGDEKAVWTELRSQAEAGWLGLATPGFLLRPPVGEGYKPFEDYTWEEFSPEEGAGGLLWGDPALAVACLLAQDYMRAGWTFKPGAKSELPGVPMFVHRTEDDQTTYTVAQIFTSKIGQQVVKHGGMPLLSVRGRDAIEVGKVVSLAIEPPDLLGRWERPETSDVPSAAARGAASPLKSKAASSSSDDEDVDDGLAALMDGGSSSDESSGDSSSDDFGSSDDEPSDSTSDDFGSSDDDAPSDSTSDDLSSSDDDDLTSDAASDDLTSSDDDDLTSDAASDELTSSDDDDISADAGSDDVKTDDDDLDSSSDDDLESKSDDDLSTDADSDDLSSSDDDDISSDAASDDLSASDDDDLSTDSSSDDVSTDADSDDLSTDSDSEDLSSSDEDSSSSDDEDSSSSDDDDPYAGLDDDSSEPTREPDPEPPPKPEPKPEPLSKAGRKPSKDPYGDLKKAQPPKKEPEPAASSGGFDFDAYLKQGENVTQSDFSTTPTVDLDNYWGEGNRDAPGSKPQADDGPKDFEEEEDVDDGLAALMASHGGGDESSGDSDDFGSSDDDDDSSSDSDSDDLSSSDDDGLSTDSSSDDLSTDDDDLSTDSPSDDLSTDADSDDLSTDADSDDLSTDSTSDDLSADDDDSPTDSPSDDLSADDDDDLEPKSDDLDLDAEETSSDSPSDDLDDDLDADDDKPSEEDSDDLSSDDDLDSPTPEEEPAGDLEDVVDSASDPDEPTADDEPPSDDEQAEDAPAEDDPYAGLDDDDDEPTAEPEESTPDDEPAAVDDDYPPPDDEPSSDDETNDVAGRSDFDEDEGDAAMSTAEDTDLEPEGQELLEKIESGDYQPFANGSPVVLNFRDLIQPVSEDEPAGDSRAMFSYKEKFDENRKEINPDNWDADDPMRPSEPKFADWHGTVELAQEALTSKCKHLQIAAYLLEGLTKQHGFAGFRDGLHLMRLLVTVCWNRILPEIEDPDEDLERRAGPFNWFDEPTRSALFPNTVRQIPVLFLGEDGYGWQQWKDSQEQKRGMKPEMIEQAMLATPRERIQTAFDDATACLVELQEIGKYLDRKMGSVAPGMTMIRTAVSECRQFLQQSLQRKGPSASELAEADDHGAGGGAVVPAAGGDYVAGTVTVSGGAASVEMVRRPVTRDDIYRQLKSVAEQLAKMEPHSPVPYLIERCVTLGAMPFPMLMRALIRDMNVIAEMNRELGIKEDEAAPEDNSNSGW